MTAAQTAKYFAEFGHLRDVLRARGMTSKQIDDHRHAITLKALGRAKSSKDFTNADFDAVLKRISAERAPGDFDAQMKLQDSPDNRRAAKLEACKRACQQMAELGETKLATNADAYISGIAQKVIKKKLDDCTAEELAIVLGCLERKLGVMRKNERAAAPLVAGEDY